MIDFDTKGLLIVISGPSGAGKGTICRELRHSIKNTWISISMTTREMREGEVEGKDYFYVSKEEFEDLIKNDAFLEYATVYSNQYYGTPKEKVLERLEMGFDVILEIDIQGALKIKESWPTALFIFIMPPSMDELKRRLVHRGTESEDKIKERFNKAYAEINEVSEYNYVVVNDEIEKAVEKVDSIIKAEKCRVSRISNINKD